MPMGAIHRNFELGAYMRTTMRHLVKGQSIADTPMNGNVALKTPVYDWGYYVMISKMARMAELTGHAADAQAYGRLASDIKEAFNKAFFNESLGRYASAGNAGADGATQTAQALALDAGLVPAEHRRKVLDALVELVYAFHPNGDGPHFSGGTIGMAPIVRSWPRAAATTSCGTSCRRTTSPATDSSWSPRPPTPAG
jgi:alpha-L-rhamnosidase